MTEFHINPDCPSCAAMAKALRDAMSLLSAVDSDANNVQFDISRLRRKHHSPGTYSG